MKKILKIAVVSLFTTLLVSGCVSDATGTADAKTAEYIHVKNEMTIKEIHHAIVQAAQDDGWRITEFKENTLIAEKSQGGEMQAVTISFSKNYFYLSPRNSDLEDILEDTLEK